MALICSRMQDQPGPRQHLLAGGREQETLGLALQQRRDRLKADAALVARLRVLDNVKIMLNAQPSAVQDIVPMSSGATAALSVFEDFARGVLGPLPRPR